MASTIIGAVARGYTSQTILKQIAKKYPQHAQKIENALSAGYAADTILKYISDTDNKYDKDQFLTEHEQTIRNDEERRKRNALGLVGALGTTGALAAGIYAYSTRNRPQVLPAQQRRPPPTQQQPIIDITPRGPGGGSPQLTPPAQRLGYNAPKPQPPSPQGPNPNLPQAPQPRQAPQRNPEQSVSVIKNMREDARLENIVRSGHDIATATMIAKHLLPKSKVAVLEKLPGGLEGVIQDYTQYIEAQPPAVRQQMPMQAQQQAQLPQIQEASQQLQREPEQRAQIPQEQIQQQSEAVQPISQIYQEMETPDIRQRTQQAAFAGEQPKPIESYAMRKESFHVPNYHYAGESKKDFDNRKILFDAANKAAEAITKGMDFTDFPVNKEAVYSSAADVLRFLAGIPNVLNAALDEEEKQELSDSLISEDKMTERMRPSEGERNIHGAQMTPNLIWNLLQSVEPRLSNMERMPSIKGHQMAPGGKMGTAELRRFLTHNVYDVLSGKTVSSELANVIGKVSDATSKLDLMIQAASAGNMRRMIEYMEELDNDHESFLELMNSITDEELEMRSLTPKGQEEKKAKEKEQKKGDISYKAAEKRKKKSTELMQE